MSLVEPDILEKQKAREGPGVSIFDESLLTGAFKSYQLLCSIDRQFIGLSAVDPKERKFYAFEGFHLPKNLNDEQLAQRILTLAMQSAILKKIDFRNVSVQITNNHFTLVPAALFRNEDIEEYYFMNQSRQGEIEIKADELKAYGLVNVFSVSKTIQSALKKVFEQFTLHHHVSSLLEAVRIEQNKGDRKNLFIHVHSDYLDIVVTEGKKLLLCNTFGYKSVEDVLYYVLFVCEQLQINTEEEVQAIISGEVEKESALSNLLKAHFRNLTFSSRIKSATFTYGFDNLPEHFYFSAFSHFLTV